MTHGSLNGPMEGRVYRKGLYTVMPIRKKKIDDIRKEVDDILDMYFEELANCFEKRKDIQFLRGWLRVNLHKAVTGMKPGTESWYKGAHPGIIALLAISVVNLVLLFFRYIVDPY